MRQHPTILLSYDHSDEKTASRLKAFLENIFPDLNVYVSVFDNNGGDLWIQKLKNTLRNARMIIPLISNRSLSNKWVFFESGAGFQDGRTTPLLIDGLTTTDLEPPFSFLHSRALSKQGLRLLIADIAKKMQSNFAAPVDKINAFLLETEKSIAKPKIGKLIKLLPKEQIYPQINRQWIYQERCLVFDYLIENTNRISIDIYFHLDDCQIQLFGRDEGSRNYLFNKMCRTPSFLPKPFEEYETVNDRLLFAKLDPNEPAKTIAKSIISLLTRIERYKLRKDSLGFG